MLALHLLKNDETNPVSKNKVTNAENYVALSHDRSQCTDSPLKRLYDRWLTCTSQCTQTPDKVFHKLLVSFHMQKKLLGLQRNQIFNQGKVFFGGRGWGVGWGAKWSGEMCVSWLGPRKYSMRNSEAVLSKDLSRTDVYKFFNSIVDLWNSLPVTIRITDHLSLLSKKVNEFYIDQFSSNKERFL